MGNFLKHVGLNNAQKVIIIYNKVPSEEHMALVLYEDKLPALYADAVHKALVSKEGQSSINLSDALCKVTLPDDRNLLTVLHKEGHIKKVQTNQTFITPNSVNKIRLSELNDTMDKIASGGEAAKKLAEFDAARGMNEKKRRNKIHGQLAVEEIAEENNAVISEINNQILQLTNAVDAMLIEIRKLKGEKIPTVETITESSKQIPSKKSVEKITKAAKKTTKVAKKSTGIAAKN